MISVKSISICFAAFFTCASSNLAFSQTYPTRVVTVVVPTPAGGGVDFVGRLVARHLQTSLQKSFIVENKGGASGNIGTLFAARAQPDGHTLLIGTSGYHVTNPTLFPGNTWDPVKDFTPIALLVDAPHVLVVNKSVPADTLQQLIAFGKSNPGKLNYATPGTGTQNHIGSELLAKMTGIKLTHVPYRGSGPATADLVSGVVEMMLNTPQSLIAHIDSGAVKPLTMASPERFKLLPSIPSSVEAGLPGFNISTWYGLYGPAGMPRDIVDMLAGEMRKMLELEDVRSLLDKNAFTTKYLAPDDFRAFTQSQSDFWSRTIKELGITVN